MDVSIICVFHHLFVYWLSLHLQITAMVVYTLTTTCLQSDGFLELVN